MATPNKIKQIAQKYGEPIEDVILRVLNEHKTIRQAAQALDVTEANLSQWVSRHGIKKHTTVEWIK